MNDADVRKHNQVSWDRHEMEFIEGDMADLYSIGDETHIKKSIDDGFALESGHTLQDQIGGQLNAGFLLSGFYKDRYHPADEAPLSNFLDTFIATRATKP